MEIPITLASVPIELFLGGMACVCLQRRLSLARLICLLIWGIAGLHLGLSIHTNWPNNIQYLYKAFFYPVFPILCSSKSFSITLFPLSIFVSLFLFAFLGSLYIIANPQKQRNVCGHLAFLQITICCAFLILFGENLLLFCMGWSFASILAYISPTSRPYTRTPLLGLTYPLLQQHLFADLCTAFGLLIFALNRHSFDLSTIFRGDFWTCAAWNQIPADQQWMYMVAGALIIIGVLVKSLQNPFQNWIAKSPTVSLPLQAILYYGIIAHSGLYLLFKMNHFFALTPVYNMGFVLLGGVMMLFGNFRALFKDNIKQLMAYNTSGILGIILFLYGLQLYDIALNIFCMHFLFKICVVFLADMVMQITSGEQVLSQMGGLRTRTPYTYALMLVTMITFVSSLVISDGFRYSEVLDVLYRSGNIVLFVAYCFSIILVGITCVRFTILAFLGKCRAEEHVEAYIREAPIGMLMSSACIVLFSLFSAYLLLSGTLRFPEFLAAWVIPVHRIFWIGILKFLICGIVIAAGLWTLYAVKHIIELMQSRIHHYRQMLVLAIRVQRFCMRKLVFLRKTTVPVKVLRKALQKEYAQTDKDMRANVYWLEEVFPDRLEQNVSSLAAMLFLLLLCLAGYLIFLG